MVTGILRRKSLCDNSQSIPVDSLHAKTPSSPHLDHPISKTRGVTCKGKNKQNNKNKKKNNTNNKNKNNNNKNNNNTNNKKKNNTNNNNKNNDNKNKNKNNNNNEIWISCPAEVWNVCNIFYLPASIPQKPAVRIPRDCAPRTTQNLESSPVGLFSKICDASDNQLSTPGHIAT